jgi:caffeoyl-CoA O-methyltransferase
MTGETTRFVALIVRATRARRVLEIGTGAGRSASAIAEALPADGTLITIERDPTLAAAAREAFASAGLTQRVTTIIGDAARYLHKISGPFDVVFQDGDIAQYEALHDRLVQLLAPSATLITHNTNLAGGYNGMLAADPRLMTMTLSIGEGLALSVRRGYDA